MNRLIPAICFVIMTVTMAQAKVTPIGSLSQLPPVQQPSNQPPKVRMIEEEDFEKIIAEGFAHVQKADPSKINMNTNLVKGRHAQQQKDENKSIFEKIYDKALERIDSSVPKPQRNDVMPSHQTPPVSVEDQQKQWRQNGNIPVIKAELPPDNRPTDIVALEHIPYLMNSIEILPSGLVKFEETVVVVANGEKLRRGLTKILPSKIYNTQGKAHRLDYSVIGVTVNDEPQEYMLTSNDENVYLIPKNDYELESGVYTYKFEYVADNLLWKEGDNYQFFWDVGGNGWNLVVDRLGASLNMPVNAWKESSVLLGSPLFLQTDAVEIRQNGPTALAYVAQRPLFIGEGMYLMAVINPEALLPETLWQKFIRFFYDWSSVIIAVVGFVMISVSFIISWRFIVKDKGQMKLSLNKTAMAIGYLMFDKFDMKSLCGFLLEMYKKNIIDIQQAEDTILLIKKTDNLNSLNANEKKAVGYLFPKHETVFNVSPKNKLPFKRFANALKKSLINQMRKFRMKLSGGYLLMGIAVVLVTEAVIALFGYRFFYDFGVMVLASFVGGLAVSLFMWKPRWWIKAIARLIAIDILLLGWILFSAVIHPVAGIFLLAAFGSIGIALSRYSKRNGLIRHYIKDIENFRDYLVKHRDSICLGKDFQNYQPAILALDLEDEVTTNGAKEYDKLSIMKNIVRLFS